MRRKLLWAVAIAALIFGYGSVARADDPPAVSQIDMLRFFGRWDLRTPNQALTVNSGSYVLAQFSGTAIDALFDISRNKGGFPTITWRIDDGPWQESEVWSRRKLAEGLPTGTHTVWLMVRGIDQGQVRWKQPLTGSVDFTSFDLPGGGTLQPPLEEWNHPKLKMEFLGDSITEGVLVMPFRDGKTSPPWRSDALDSYSCQTAMKLGAMWRQVGFGATGLERVGGGGAPGALDSFNFFYDGCPRDDWQPDVVVVNQGTNDGATPPEQYAPLYAKYLALIRQAYPKAKIVALRPFNGCQATAIKNKTEEARAAGDAGIYFIDTTGWYATAPVHPDAKASVGISDHLVAALKANVLTAPATP